MMATETEEQSESDQEAMKLQQAMFVGRYHPTQGRADKLAANIPGGHQSSWGNNGDHTIGHGGAN
jgi:hypothetical protein